MLNPGTDDGPMVLTAETHCHTKEGVEESIRILDEDLIPLLDRFIDSQRMAESTPLSIFMVSDDGAKCEQRGGPNSQPGASTTEYTKSATSAGPVSQPVSLSGRDKKRPRESGEHGSGDDLASPYDGCKFELLDQPTSHMLMSSLTQARQKHRKLGLHTEEVADSSRGRLITFPDVAAMDDLPGSTGKIAETRITHPIGVTAGMPAFQASSPLPLLDERDRGDQINNCAMDDSIAAQPKHRDDGSLSHSPIRSGDAHPSIMDGICSGSAQQRDHALPDRANAEIDVERSYDGLEDWLVDDAYSLAQGSGDRACDSRASISSAESPRQSSLSNKADYLQGASISPGNLYKTYRSVGIQVGAAVDIRAPRRYSSAPPS